MKTLVLCVDRDDDVGTKTPVKGPLIGRDENLVAATKLGLADPEDSDVNALLTAISVYDERVSLGEDAEIATITGDVRVGPISDRILTKQLERVLEEVKPDRAFLVSDGAEDEYIFPIISSRIRVDHVRRVFVRQSPAIESTYYMIVKAMRNPKGPARPSSLSWGPASGGSCSRSSSSNRGRPSPRISRGERRPATRSSWPVRSSQSDFSCSVSRKLCRD